MYHCFYLTRVFDARWEWIGDWEIDKSKRFGESDADGYMYATNFERLLEMIRSQTTMGTPSAASLVRRR